MRIKMWKRRLKSGNRLEEHELELGKYNEVYLPSVSLDEELWVVVVDAAGAETVLRLKG